MSSSDNKPTTMTPKEIDQSLPQVQRVRAAEASKAAESGVPQYGPENNLPQVYSPYNSLGTSADKRVQDRRSTVLTRYSTSAPTSVSESSGYMPPPTFGSFRDGYKNYQAPPSSPGYVTSTRGSVSSRKVSSATVTPAPYTRLTQWRLRKPSSVRRSSRPSSSRGAPESEPEPGFDSMTEAQKTEFNRWHAHIAAKYIPCYEDLKRRNLDPRLIGSKYGEWNPAQDDYGLQHLDLPWEMRMDCIFDRRNLETDILQTVAQWRKLRDDIQKDGELRAHLDTLAELHDSGVIKPFDPLASYLTDWTWWRKLCKEPEGEDKYRHRRPKIWKRPNEFFRKHGASEIENNAVTKLKDLLDAQGPREREVMYRLALATEEIKLVIKERGTPFLPYVAGMTMLNSLMQSGEFEDVDEAEDEE